MTTWSNQSKNTATWGNNIISPEEHLILRETGSAILRENGTILLREDIRTSWGNSTKNTTTWGNQSKN